MFIRFSTDDRPPHWPLESIGSETLLTPYFCVLEKLLQSIFHCDRETTILFGSQLSIVHQSYKIYVPRPLPLLLRDTLSFIGDANTSTDLFSSDSIAQRYSDHLSITLCSRGTLFRIKDQWQAMA